MNPISTSMPPRISLVCVVLNVAKYIEETIKSIQSQSSNEWELILIDGASTDGTVEIITKYAKEDSRIKFKSEPDEGPWDATEKGMAMARGEFVMLVAGQDGFLDREWFEKCLKVFDSDKSISLVWASTRGMSEDGVLWPEEHVTYSHFIKKESRIGLISVIIKKIFKIIKDLIFGNILRKKILLRKIFSKTSRLKFNFFTQRSFKEEAPLRKEAWFRYWLETGIPFSEQPMCLAKKVYFDCVSKYPRGSRIIMDHITEFHYNFNAKGYLSFYIPTLAAYGRAHSDNSGARIPEELYRATEVYLQKVLALRKKIVENHEEMIFIDRDKNIVSRVKF